MAGCRHQWSKWSNLHFQIVDWLSASLRWKCSMSSLFTWLTNFHKVIWLSTGSTKLSNFRLDSVLAVWHVVCHNYRKDHSCCLGSLKRRTPWISWFSLVSVSSLIRMSDNSLIWQMPTWPLWVSTCLCATTVCKLHHWLFHRLTGL